MLANVRTPVTMLLYPTNAFSTAELIRREFRDSTHLSPSSRARLSELVAFAPGLRPQLVLRRTGTAGRDTVQLRFDSTVVRLPLTIWVVEAPFDSTMKLVQRHLAGMRATWEAQAGIGLGDVRIVDATQSPALAHLRERLATSCSADTWARVGSDAGRLNAYYLGQPQIGSAAYCGEGHMEIYPLSKSRPDVTLAHEIGHGFLGNHHELPTNNVMATLPVGTSFRLSLGQIFRAHFWSQSILNTMFRAYPEALQRPCAPSPTSSTPLCPPTSYGL